MRLSSHRAEYIANPAGTVEGIAPPAGTDRSAFRRRICAARLAELTTNCLPLPGTAPREACGRWRAPALGIRIPRWQRRGTPLTRAFARTA